MLKRELKINLKSLIIWVSLTMFLFLIVFLVYPSIMGSESSANLNEIMDIFPEEVLKMFNMDLAEINTPFGWFKTEGGVFLVLIYGIYASILGVSILSKEESEKTIEFLYSKPISRNKIVLNKMLAGLINILALIMLVTIFNVIGLAISDDLELDLLLKLSLAPLITCIPLFFISMLITTCIKKIKRIAGIGIGVAFISYFIQLIGNMSEEIKFIKYFSLFTLSDSRDIITSGNINWVCILIGLGISVASVLAILKVYNKKELV